MKYWVLIFCYLSVFSSFAAKEVKVKMITNYGDIELALFEDDVPKTVANFLSYVDKKFYDGLIFHRVIPDFMIQGGGFDETMKQKDTAKPIKNEASLGISKGHKNEIGTIAMARTPDPHSATSQFFINTKDNDFLNFSLQNKGYAVFGKVTKGMPVVKKISAVKTGSFKHFSDVPKSPVIIKSIRRVK